MWVAPNDLRAEDYGKVEKANDDMELANLTYDMCSDLHRFDDVELSQSQIEQLKDVAQELMFASLICLGIYVALETYSMELTTVMVLVVVRSNKDLKQLYGDFTVSFVYNTTDT